MDRPGQVAGVVNVQRVNPNQYHASFHEEFSGVLRQEGMALKVLVRSPVCVPASADQDCLASKVVALESGSTDRPAILAVGRNHDGFEVCQEIKGSTETRSIPILMITARKDPESRKRGLEVGASEYLVKLYLMWDALLRRRTDGALVRLANESGGRHVFMNLRSLALSLAERAQ